MSRDFLKLNSASPRNRLTPAKSGLVVRNMGSVSEQPLKAASLPSVCDHWHEVNSSRLNTTAVVFLAISNLQQVQTTKVAD